jgi:ribonuclease BN (tRNA processing enzyme)
MLVRINVARVKNGATLRKHLLASHTAVEDVGRIASAAKVKLLVMSHLVPGDLDVTDEQWLTEARKTFAGRTMVARDLMELKLPV